MSTTSTERMRERHRRRARREVQLTIVLHEDDLAEIAKRGYESAASNSRRQISVCSNMAAKVNGNLGRWGPGTETPALTRPVSLR